MYIEKRKIGKNIKYYLSHSFREGKKIHKIRKFLGKDLSKEKLEERRKIAEKLILEEINQYKIISDPLKIPLKNEEIEFIKNLTKKEKLQVFHLSEKQWEKFSEIFTYSTNAIEGSELDLKEVENILEKDKWPEKSKEDIAETYGVDEAIKFIRKTKEHISLALIKELHKIVFKNSKGFAGKLRKAGWKSEQIDYALKKHAGKTTGMFEIPVLKFLNIFSNQRNIIFSSSLNFRRFSNFRSNVLSIFVISNKYLNRLCLST